MSTTTAPPRSADAPTMPPINGLVGEELTRALAEVKGQAQFLLYLADQIEDSLQQLDGDDSEPGHSAFLCRVLNMYSGQLELRYQNLGDKISEACQEIYVAVRELDLV
jgi:hypothetical protein